MSGPEDLTLLLNRWRRGDDEAAAELLSTVYRDLRRMASRYMMRERLEHTLQATALVHEAWIRLSKSATPPSGDRHQFFGAMAAYMRRQLVDHARRRISSKRGGRIRHVPIDESLAAVPRDASADDALEGLESAIAALTALHPRCAEVLQLRFFAKMSIEQTARELGIATGTVKRDFVFARAFLAARLSDHTR